MIIVRCGNCNETVSVSEDAGTRAVMAQHKEFDDYVAKRIAEGKLPADLSYYRWSVSSKFRTKASWSGVLWQQWQIKKVRGNPAACGISFITGRWVTIGKMNVQS